MSCPLIVRTFLHWKAVFFSELCTGFFLGAEISTTSLSLLDIGLGETMGLLSSVVVVADADVDVDDDGVWCVIDTN
jgi:hypothetical protein